MDRWCLVGCAWFWIWAAVMSTAWAKMDVSAARTLYAKGYDLYQKGRCSVAIPVFRKGLAVLPKQPKDQKVHRLRHAFLFLLGMCYYKQRCVERLDAKRKRPLHLSLSPVPFSVTLI